MNRNDPSSGLPAEKSSASVSIPPTEEFPPRAREAFKTPTLNFHTAEFNRIDDLNDLSGNYRSFHSLEGVVTADMRHQMERPFDKASFDLPVEKAGDLKQTEPENDGAENVERPALLTLISQGRILIIDTQAERALALGKVLGDRRMTCTVAIVSKPPAAMAVSPSSRSGWFEVEGCSISGSFGGFLARATIKGEEKSLSVAMDDREAVFDLVLDLQSQPSYVGDCLPLGYYAPRSDPAALEEALAELPEMRGKFKKPQFTSLRKNRCFHGRSAARDCRRCLEICPFGAIRSLDRTISIDPTLCQGCGGCVLICPAEAIRWQAPSPETLLHQLRSRLERRSISPDSPITLVILDSESSGDRTGSAGDENENEQKIHFRVESIAQVGLEVPLAALAYGAEKVLVVCGPQNAPRIRKAVEGEMQTARAILAGLGLPEDLIQCVAHSPESPGPEKKPLQPFGGDGPVIDSPRPPATFSPDPDKRRMVRLAVQHLYEQSRVLQPVLPLPMGSSFGAVVVEGKACTLCLACVAACPSQALSAGGPEPRLRFRESLCHQCGLCQATCPEGAIRLLPRLLCDPEAVDAPKDLHRAEPVRCVECGRAFASPALIDRVQEKLRGHWMYAEERQRRRLRMCGPCRTRDTLMSEDLSEWKPH